MMGRKTGISDGSKAQVHKTSKSKEGSKLLKRPQQKPTIPTSSVGAKKKLVQSKPGFTVYRTGSSKSKPETQTDGRSTATKTETIKEDSLPGLTDIVSQVQLQDEKTKSVLTSSLHIPTAGHDSMNSTDELCDVLNTPFNKRLVSSTPDPERLRESYYLDESAQMIPERDVEGMTSLQPEEHQDLSGSVACESQKGVDTATGANQSTDKETSNWSDPSVKSKHAKVPSWVQKHRKWEEELEKFKSSKRTDLQQKADPLNSVVVSVGDWKGATAASVVKAEWVSNTKRSEFNAKSSVPNAKSSEFSGKPSVSNTKCPESSKKDMKKTKDSQNHKLNTQSSAPSSSAKALVNTSNTASTFEQHSSGSLALGQEHTELDSENTALLNLNSNSIYKPLTFAADLLEHKNSSVPATSKASEWPTSGCPAANAIVVSDTSPTQSLAPKQANLVVSTSAGLDSCLPKQSHEVQSSANVGHDVFNKSPKLKLDPRVITEKLTSGGNGEDQQKFLPSYKAEEEDHQSKILSLKTFKPDLFRDMNNRERNKMPVIRERKTDSHVSATRELVKIPTAQDLNSTVDSCDLEVGSVNASPASQSQALQDNRGSEKSAKALLKSSPNTSVLSEVIHILKTDAFNAEQPKRVNESLSDSSHESEKQRQLPIESPISTARSQPRTSRPASTPSGGLRSPLSTSRSASTPSEGLKKIMAQYLNSETQNLNSGQTYATPKGETTVSDLKGSDTVSTPRDATNNIAGTQLEEMDSNQNYRSDDDSDYGPARRPQVQNLRYIENMADPTLRDIACRLAFKATALRDVELRDLVDDMIFHTDAALGQIDVKIQSAQLFYQDENSKLKKRLHNVNRQLDAKERQEKMSAANFHNHSDALQLERKMMYLRQEKDKLDGQVTTLLEEKAKWLATQQDLVRTISLKDHEILKQQEKHQQDMTRLHQSIDQATQNSQGVHFKLSVADREISNMEQRLKCRDLDIADLKEKLRHSELSLSECKQQALKKDQEMLRLQDVVDALKIGVDHVLHTFEAGSYGRAATPQQAQGIDNLRRMAHPELFASSSPTWREPSHVSAPSDAQHPTSYMSTSLPSSVHTSMLAHPYDQHFSAHVRIPEPQMHHPIQTPVQPVVRTSRGVQTERYQKSFQEVNDNGADVMPWAQRRLQEVEQEEAGRLRWHKRSKEKGGSHRLTPAALEKHNQRLSPIDRRLWHSMQEPVGETYGEPYYSDSEIERSRTRPKSILKPNDRWSGRRWKAESYHDNDDDMDDEWRENTRKRYRQRRKSESDKYPPIKRTSRNKTYVRERGSSNEFMEEETDQAFERNSSKPRMSSYFLKYSSMPQLRRESDKKHSKENKDSHSTRYFSIASQTNRKSSENRASKARKRHSPESEFSPLMSRSISDDSIEQNFASSLEEVNFHSMAKEPRAINISQGKMSDRQNSRKREGWSRVRSSSPGIKKKSPVQRRRSKSLEQPYFYDTTASYTKDKSLQTLEPDELISTYRSKKMNKSTRSSLSDPGPKSPDKQYFTSSKRSKGELSRGHHSSYATRGSNAPMSSSPLHISEVSLSRRATRGSDPTQREFFEGTALSASMSSIDENNAALTEASNNSELASLNEDIFTTGIASLDAKIANLQRKIDRAKALFS